MKMAEAKKICSRCKRELPLASFSIDRSTKDELDYRCKDCRKELYYLHHKRNIETKRRYRRNHHDELKKRYDRDRLKRLRTNKLCTEKIKFKAFRKLCDPPSCKECKTNDLRVLSIDHINDDGYKDKLRSAHLWRKILYKMTEEEAQKEYQLLCRNCNWIKRLRRTRFPDLVIKSLDQLDQLV